MPEYNRLKIQDLRQIGKDMGLLRVDKDKKKDLIARIEKGRQLSDYSKKVLLEQAQNIALGKFPNVQGDNHQKTHESYPSGFGRKKTERRSEATRR